MGSIWTAVSVENRFYFGENNENTNYKTLFCMQGTTFYLKASNPQRFTFNLTIGKDVPFKNSAFFFNLVHFY